MLAAILTALGLGLFLYKAFVLRFPLSPKTDEQIWNVEARVGFVAQGGPVKLSLFIPSGTKGFAVIDEKFISRGYGLVASRDDGNRQAVWSIRSARGKQSLYYQAAILGMRTEAPTIEQAPPHTSPKGLEGPALEAANAVVADLKSKSADTPSMAAALIKAINQAEPTDNLKILLGTKPSTGKKANMAVRLLGCAGVPARVVRGVQLQEGKIEFSKKTPLLYWIEVSHKRSWLSFDPVTGTSPVPKDWLPWWRGPKRMVNLEGGTDLQVSISLSPKVEQAVAAAVRRGEISKPLLLEFSLFSLPVNTQAVYRVLLLIPLGAFVLVLMRNLVGIKTFGTFMPVLIGLSFRETGLLWGVLLFTVVAALGLSVRFYLERLKLLAVPRLAAVLIVVIIVMVALSIFTHKLGVKAGLSVALFPMVIITMTIERMSILWEERGPGEALISGLGSLLTAAMAFVVMNVKLLEHLVFVFPELLLVILAGTLLLGRYSGYRLADFYRFRALARG